MRAPAFVADLEGCWDGSSPASPLGSAADPDTHALPPLLSDLEASGPAEELVEALCSLPQLPTMPATTVRWSPQLPTLPVRQCILNIMSVLGCVGVAELACPDWPVTLRRQQLPRIFAGHCCHRDIRCVVDTLEGAHDDIEAEPPASISIQCKPKAQAPCRMPLVRLRTGSS